MKVYEDSRGWRYRVMPGIDTPSSYKARYNKPEKRGWKCVAALPWRKSEAEAEKDLAAYAARHGMKEEFHYA